MAAPTKDKTWEYDLNNLTVGDATNSPFGAFDSVKETLFNIKESLKNAGPTTFTTPWVVQESSDSVTVGGIGYGVGPDDKWLTAANLIWADEDTANARSWIVLRQTGISAKFELMLSCQQDSQNNDGKQISAYVAQSGFRLADGGTDGTIGVPPTASDQVRLRNSNSDYWGVGPVNTAYTSYHNVMMSSDGECTRILIFINNTNTGFWIFDVPKNPTTGWTDPYIAAIRGQADVTTDQARYQDFYDNDNMLSHYTGASVDTLIYLAGEGSVNNGIGEQLGTPNQLDNEYIASEMSLASETTSFIGMHGNVYDLWWGFNWVRTGRYFPEAGTRLFIQVADMVFPWDGSTTILTR